jgi:glycine/D-amino acid oxidase-like deaminating enzyme
MQKAYDAVIIGGGIVGTSAAYFMAKSGKRVALVEKGRVAGEQSSRNWGAVRVQGRDRAEIPLMLECIEIWKTLERELGEAVDWRQQGQMLVAYNQKQLARLEGLTPTAKEFGIPSKILTKAEVRDTLPHYHGEACVGALFNSLDGCAEPEKVAPAFARGAKRLGADIFEFCAAKEIETANGAVSGVETEVGFLKCDTVVLASGVWTSRLAKSLNIKHPSLWIRGSVARTAPLPIEMRKLVVWGATAYRQRLDGRVNIAVSEDGFHDLMLDSLIHGHKFLPLARKNFRLLRFHLGKPFAQSLMGKFSNYTTHRTS